jgi:hypothetical protein
MPTPLYPTFRKRAADAIEQLIRQQVTPWSFMAAGPPFRIKYFDGRQIAYEGVTFDGSPRKVFWSRYIEPYLEELCISEITAAVSMAHEKQVDAKLLLPELQGLLSAGFQKVYGQMADVDRRLRGKGYPQNVSLRPIDQELRAMEQFLDERIRSEIEMWKPKSGRGILAGQNMSTEQELLNIALEIGTLEGRFIESGQLGLHLQADDEAEFKRLTVEAKSILDTELGGLNDFSMNIIHSINSGSGGFLGGPSLASVKEVHALLQGAVNHIRRRPGLKARAPAPVKPSYVAPSRLAELRALTGCAWDTRRLVRLCEELNASHDNDCHMTTAMLVRAIVDHVPPIFCCKSFDEVANNYKGAKSFRDSMRHLNQSLRNIADAHLHVQIRASEILPTDQQVDFRAGLDVLLAEVVRVLK